MSEAPVKIWERVVKRIRAERNRQDAKWGRQSHSMTKWLVILGEEFGEACEALLEGDREKFEHEITQASAVGVAILEVFERRRHPERVYLAGPIDGNKTSDETHLWREQATEWLDLTAVDPTVRIIPGGTPYPREKIVDPDLKDIDSCDVLLANCWKPSFGTPMEILYAWEREKVIVIVVPDLATTSPWLKAHSHVLIDNLEDACDRINQWAENCAKEKGENDGC